MSNAIGWCEATLNPLVGCTKVGPACDHCYAERMARRLQAMGTRGYEGVVDEYGRWTGRVNFVESVLAQITPRQKPKTIFMGSMSDLFHEVVCDEWLDTIFATMALCPQHKFIVLTKRIRNARAYFTPQDDLWADRWPRAMNLLCGECEPTVFPLPNVELDVSIWDQASADAAIPVLLDTPAAMRGLSIEPMLGPIIIKDIERLDRVILGGENGPGARPMQPDWARSVRDQCVDAGVPFWFKSWGDAEIGSLFFPILAGRDPYAKHGGHLLDGREWLETPEQKG